MTSPSAPPSLVFDGREDAARTIALAHGAGAPMDSPFMGAFAEGLAARGFRVARFEFPYMAARRGGGPRRPPDPAPTLLETWRAVIRRLGAEGLVIGGKSLGGRMASLVADDMGVAGLVCLGYPFHPPDRPEALRTEHLKTLKTPTLIVQGERDPFGSCAEVVLYRLSSAIRLHWLADGDHGFRPRRESGLSERENWGNGIAAVAAFVASL